VAGDACSLVCRQWAAYWAAYRGGLKSRATTATATATRVARCLSRVRSTGASRDLKPGAAARLNPRYVFQNFVVAETAIAWPPPRQVALQRIQAPITIPLYPQHARARQDSPPQAIAQRTTQCKKVALYVTSEQFTNDFVTAIAQGRSDEFRRRYRSPRLPARRRHQFFAGKGRTQEEFFYTFNDLHSDGCQVVVAGDRPRHRCPVSKAACARASSGAW
jgi:chromosomal replication initiation ATPase DnaA